MRGSRMYEFLAAMGYKITPEKLEQIKNLAFDISCIEGHPWGYKARIPDLKTWLINLEW